ncbi:hypothetical protein BGX21_004936 [Mortierella sp. AD011]|nr:hypothetical protein BGX20_009040 [Mortierella sp. AD010]KAF9400136.1 hypothetical protein BGX21_004936 [Mortierella sp. AD011]
MSTSEKSPTPGFMTLEVIDQMDKSAVSVTAFVRQLRSLNITKLAEHEKKEYLDIVGRYEYILESLLKYIGNEKPKFEYLQVAVTQARPDIYETLCSRIDIETPKKIYDDVSNLQKLVKDRKQALGTKRRDKVLRLVVMGGAGVCLLIASIATALITLASAGGGAPLIVPIITTAFTIFSGLGGFKLILDIIQSGAENVKLTIIDKNLATLEKHLGDVRKKCDELKEANNSFKLDMEFKNFDVKDHDHTQIAEAYVSRGDVGNQCHMCRLMIICKRLTKMEDVIRNGV